MPKIGKNVLENLTQGMYKDALIIYREYIQNAADQIDKARASAAFPDEELDIVIDIDERARRVTIEDNANGIPQAEVARRLGDVADSEKVQGEEKGFRGIGRLGGLAYCRELRFITTYAGEAQQTTMIWDAATLEKILNDRDDHSSAEDILDRIIRYEHAPCDEASHFFRVELLDVKASNDRLLNAKDVGEYISEVAPLDYGETFQTLAPKIRSFIDDQKMRTAITPPHHGARSSSSITITFLSTASNSIVDTQRSSRGTTTRSKTFTPI
ncbi:MAG: ATP-binding protein [Selenomonadaceae bacterium]|nr:ATP-binding protein [Selenomonadaceae bacterium]